MSSPGAVIRSLLCDPMLYFGLLGLFFFRCVADLLRLLPRKELRAALVLEDFFSLGGLLLDRHLCSASTRVSLCCNRL